MIKDDLRIITDRTTNVVKKIYKHEDELIDYLRLDTTNTLLDIHFTEDQVELSFSFKIVYLKYEQLISFFEFIYTK